MQIKDSYIETLQLFRHYSAGALNLRLAVLAQGLAILSGGGVLLMHGQYLYAFGSASFGVLFTTALLFFHVNLQAKCSSFAKIAKSMEAAITDGEGCMTQYLPEHETHSRGFVNDIFATNVFFTLMYFSFFVLLISIGIAWCQG